MAAKKKSDKRISGLAPKKLDAREAKNVRGGGHKHLAGVKYEDITINSGTGTPKTTP